MENKDEKEIAAKNAANLKLAIGLGVLAFAIYAGFILMYYFK